VSTLRLEEIDRVSVTTVVDNYIDSLLRDRPGARRFSSTIARKMTDLTEQVLYSRSARDLEALAVNHGELIKRLTARRPLLKHVGGGRDILERELDAERRDLMHANERRLERYLAAGRRWAQAWPAIDRDVAQLDLVQAHEVVVERAKALLPETVGDPPDSASEHRGG